MVPFHESADDISGPLLSEVLNHVLTEMSASEKRDKAEGSGRAFSGLPMT